MVESDHESRSRTQARWDASTRLQLSVWTDPAIDARGYDAHSQEFALLWTPLLGPAAAALFRVLADVVRAETDDGVHVTVATLAAAIGLGERKARTAVSRALERLQHHYFAQVAVPTVSVRRVAPPASQRNLRRLPDAWRRHALALLDAPTPAVHDNADPATRPTGTNDTPAREVDPLPTPPPRLRRAALGLLRRGCDAATVRRELARWGTTATEIDAAIRWLQTMPDAGHQPDAVADK